MSAQPQSLQIALVGNPNVGKSSVFNRLTGLRQKVGNFPGVTVDKKLGSIALPVSGQADLVDLPGLYSLYPVSEDERVVLRVFADQSSALYPDVVVYIADACDLERSCLLFSQLADLDVPIVLAINMLDSAHDNGIELNLKLLSEKLGVQVVSVNGRTGEGMTELISAIDLQVQQKACPKNFYPLTENEVLLSAEIKSFIGVNSDYRALVLAHQHLHLSHLNQVQKEFISSINRQYQFNTSSVQLDEMMKRYQILSPIVRSVITKKAVASTSNSKWDKVLTHPFFGIMIFLGLMVVVFQAIFSWSEAPMTWIEESFGAIANYLSAVLPDTWATQLLTQGVIAGLSGVLVFVPQIAILFLLISILEESGYMARVVYLFDNLLQRFGLNGRSVVALISGGACAIPAIMSTRTITNWKERLVTIMVTPLISCSARIPVFTILIAVTIPPLKVAGFLNLQGLVFLSLYFLGALAALISAWIFSKIIHTDEQSFLVMELPRYQVPQWKNVAITVVEKVKAFAWEAGRIILVVSIVLWFLASFGMPQAMDNASKQAQAEYAISQDIPLEQLESTHRLEASFAGMLGKTIEPVIAPLGYDWKIGIALISSFAAREVFVGTMATIYAVADESDDALLRERMEKATHFSTGEKVFTPAAAMSLMVFYLFALQCMSTIAVVRRETKSWKWPLIQLAYMSVLAYAASFIVYHLVGMFV